MCFAEQKTDGRGIWPGTKESVDGCEIEVELARPLGFEVPCLQLNHKIAVQAYVVEEQVEVKGLATDFKRHLAAHKRKAAAQLVAFRIIWRSFQ